MGGHNIALQNRELLEATGVTFVNSFDEQQVVLETEMGTLWLKGDNLHITELSLEQGKVVIQGKLSSLEYKQLSKGMKDKTKNVLEKILK